MIKGINGKFDWYVPINNIGNDRMAIGVAGAPEGPWKDALGKPLIDDAPEMATFSITNIDRTTHTIDPTVFILRGRSRVSWTIATGASNLSPRVRP